MAEPAEQFHRLLCTAASRGLTRRVLKPGRDDGKQLLKVLIGNQPEQLANSLLVKAFFEGPFEIFVVLVVAIEPHGLTLGIGEGQFGEGFGEGGHGRSWGVGIFIRRELEARAPSKDFHFILGEAELVEGNGFEAFSGERNDRWNGAVYGCLEARFAFSVHRFVAGWYFESSGEDDGRRDGQGIESRKQGVTPLSGTSEVGGAKGAANALLCPARSVQGEVAPVSAVVIPQVVVGIQRGGAQ